MAQAQQAVATAGVAGAGDWNSYGGTLAGNRYSTLDQITPANVTRLTQVWVQRIFAPSFDAKMWALDADTGEPCPTFAHRGYIDLRDNMGPSPAAMQISTSPPIVANAG